MNSRRVLIVGSGGREHALAWKLAQSPGLKELFIAPGNGGTGAVGTNVPIGVRDTAKLIKFVQDNNIDLTVIGPDDPLAGGVVNAFTAAGLRIFGPTKGAAQIEASKAFSKRLMSERNIPTAPYIVFTDFAEATAYATSCQIPVVVKASGLALGKGVFVCSSHEEAVAAVKAILGDRTFGDAGNEVVIEAFLEGPEVSIHALVDGQDFILFPPARDHKAIRDGNLGPNTGGMGTIAPVPEFHPAELDEISQTVVAPTLAGLAASGNPFTGVLYPGLIMSRGGPRVLEFNARFGDPETQSYMRLMRSDLLEALDAAVDHRLRGTKITWHDGYAVCIVLASAGYPGAYETGHAISGLEAANACPGVAVFHAGTKLTSDGVETSGGRVLNVTAIGKTLPIALERAYEGVTKIHFAGMQYRRDIGR